jgi:putative effector of murein hydrolase LrgA (UPF0299 family)
VLPRIGKGEGQRRGGQGHTCCLLGLAVDYLAALTRTGRMLEGVLGVCVGGGVVGMYELYGLLSQHEVV